MQLYQPKDIGFKVRILTTIVAARNRLGVIGKDNKLPWHSPEDLKHFKQVTTGTPLIMGRNTFESLPGILPGRKHVVLTSKADYAVPEGVIVAPSFEAAFQYLADDFAQAIQSTDADRLKTYQDSIDKVYWHRMPLQDMNERALKEAAVHQAALRVSIVGGADIYKQALQFADLMTITEINNKIEGDTHFPTVPETWWMFKADPLAHLDGPVVTQWQNQAT